MYLDVNEFNDVNATINTSSQCMFGKDKLFFDVNLSLSEESYVGLRIFEVSGGIITRNFHTGICK